MFSTQPRTIQRLTPVSLRDQVRANQPLSKSGFEVFSRVVSLETPSTSYRSRVRHRAIFVTAFTRTATSTDLLRRPPEFGLVRSIPWR